MTVLGLTRGTGSDGSLFPETHWWLGWQRAAEKLQEQLLGLWGVWLALQGLENSGLSELWELKANCKGLFKGTSAYILARKLISLGQCVKKLQTVGSELCFR